MQQSDVWSDLDDEVPTTVLKVECGVLFEVCPDVQAHQQQRLVIAVCEVCLSEYYCTGT